MGVYQCPKITEADTLLLALLCKFEDLNSVLVQPAVKSRAIMNTQWHRDVSIDMFALQTLHGLLTPHGCLSSISFIHKIKLTLLSKYCDGMR